MQGKAAGTTIVINTATFTTVYTQLLSFRLVRSGMSLPYVVFAYYRKSRNAENVHPQTKNAHNKHDNFLPYMGNCLGEKCGKLIKNTPIAFIFPLHQSHSHKFHSPIFVVFSDYTWSEISFNWDCTLTFFFFKFVVNLSNRPGINLSNAASLIF